LFLPARVSPPVAGGRPSGVPVPQRRQAPAPRAQESAPRSEWQSLELVFPLQPLTPAPLRALAFQRHTLEQRRQLLKAGRHRQPWSI